MKGWPKAIPFTAENSSLPNLRNSKPLHFLFLQRNSSFSSFLQPLFCPGEITLDSSPMSFTASCLLLLLSASAHLRIPKCPSVGTNCPASACQGSPPWGLCSTPSVHQCMFLQSCCEDKPCLTNPGGTTPKDDARESDAQRIPETSHQDTLKTAGLEGRSTHLCCGIPPIAFLHLGCSIPRGVSEVPLGSFYLHALGSGTTLLHSLIALCVFQFHELHYFFIF